MSIMFIFEKINYVRAFFKHESNKRKNKYGKINSEVVRIIYRLEFIIESTKKAINISKSFMDNFLNYEREEA